MIERKPFSAEELATVAKLRASGLTVSQVAQRLGRSENSIWQRLRRHNLTRALREKTEDRT